MSRFPRAHARGTKTIPPYFLAFTPGLTPGVLCWLASRVPVVFFHGCWNLLSSHGEPGTPGYPRSGSWVREAHTAGYPLAGVGEGATRAPGVATRGCPGPEEAGSARHIKPDPSTLASSGPIRSVLISDVDPIFPEPRLWTSH